MEAYKVFTVENERVSEGAKIGFLEIKSAGIEIPALLIGEKGRGRSLGAIPVSGHPDPSYPDVLMMAASIGTTRAGKPKLHWADKVSSTEKAIVVYRSQIGYRGGNYHNGDWAGWMCRGCKAVTEVYENPETCPECGKKTFYEGGHAILQRVFKELPGEVLSEGIIAQGAAGRAGFGTQYVILLPAGQVLRVERDGRLYGADPVHYTIWTGEKMLSLTPEERDATELF